MSWNASLSARSLRVEDLERAFREDELVDAVIHVVDRADAKTPYAMTAPVVALTEAVTAWKRRSPRRRCARHGHAGDGEVPAAASAPAPPISLL